MDFRDFENAASDATGEGPSVGAGTPARGPVVGFRV